jgi:hypothetical protein
MAAQAAEIPDYVTMIDTSQMTAATVASLTSQLFTEHADLPAPVMFSAHTGSPELDLQYPNRPETFRALADWADRFGGTLTGEPHTDDLGRHSVHCKVRFDYHGIQVKLYAFISTASAGS